MEPYSIDEFTQKIKKSLRVLLYLLEAKTGIKVKANNIQPHTHDKGAYVYFEIDISFEVQDPDLTSYTNALNNIEKTITDFFNKIVLTPKADFKYTKNKQPDDHDDMIGLFLNANYEWFGVEGQKNCKIKYAFEYNLYYDEYDQYYG